MKLFVIFSSLLKYLIFRIFWYISAVYTRKCISFSFFFEPRWPISQLVDLWYTPSNYWYSDFSYYFFYVPIFNLRYWIRILYLNAWTYVCFAYMTECASLYYLYFVYHKFECRPIQTKSPAVDKNDCWQKRWFTMYIIF